MKNAIIWILFICCGCCFLYGWSNRPRTATSSPIVTHDPNYVQNPYEAQERLKEQGWYSGSIDGKWGPQTDKAYGHWCAVQAFKGYEK